MPTAREVVASTAINPNTVLKAYRELEHEGLVDSRAGVGSFVRRTLGRVEAGLESPLGNELRAWMRRARDAELERVDVEALVKAVTDEIFETGQSSRPRGDAMNQPNTALEAIGIGKRYRRGWALQDCSFSLPAETVVALVGPNGAGKSTLMALATGILAPTTGVIKVLGDSIRHRGPHPKLAFLSQDRPLYKRFTVDEMLHFGRSMNDHFDDHYARRLITESDIPLTARTGTLSGGQRTEARAGARPGPSPGRPAAG